MKVGRHVEDLQHPREEASWSPLMESLASPVALIVEEVLEGNRPSALRVAHANSAAIARLAFVPGQALDAGSAPWRACELASSRGIVEMTWLDAELRVARVEGGFLVSAAFVPERAGARAPSRSNEASSHGGPSFDLLVDGVPHLVWSADESGHVDFFSARAHQYRGIRRGEDGHWDWVALVHPDDFDATKQAWEEASRTRGAYVAEHRVQTADGSYRWHVSRAHFVVAEGRGRWYGSATDIHALKASEESLRRLNLLRDRIVSAVAHDLRGPLASTSLAIDLVGTWLPHIAPSKAKESIENGVARGRAQIAKMAALIAELLDDASLHSGQALTLERSEFDLADLCHEIVSEARQLAHRRVDVVAEGELRGSWDKNRVHRVVENLLSNALKYSPGDVRVRLGREGDRVQVRVTDEGIGIASSEREAVFEWFVRGSNSSGVGGTGIGLASSRRIAELHGGSLVLAEGTERGTTFVLELPVA